MRSMRAKMIVTQVIEHHNAAHEVTGETLAFHAVAKNDGYPTDGHDEDNDYARWSPSASCEIHVANPALFGKFEPGQKYYVDFTPADA